MMNWNYEPEMSKYGNKMIPATKQLIVFLTGWIGFRILAALIQIIVISVCSIKGIDGVDYLNNVDGAMLVNTASYMSLLIAIVLIVNFDIKKLFQSFTNWQSYLAGVICLLAIFAFNIVYGMFLRLLPLPTSDNANESSINTISNTYRITSLIVFGLIGPICEEFTYRVGLFSFLKRKSRILAYVLTIIIFAFIHFNISLKWETLVNELLNLPYYMFAAFAFSYTYEKYGLAGSLTAHIANNLISLSLVSAIH